MRRRSRTVRAIGCLQGNAFPAATPTVRSRMSGDILLWSRLVTAHGRAKMIIADVPEPPKKPDMTPDVVATYCLPFSS